VLTGYFRISGYLLMVGGVLFGLGDLLTAAIFPSLTDTSQFRSPLWYVLLLGGTAFGSAIAMFGMPGLYAWLSDRSGPLASLGVAFLFLTLAVQLFFGVYLSVIYPWVVKNAPQLVGDDGPPALFMLLVFLGATTVLGSGLLAFGWLRGRLRPGWPGYLAAAWGVTMVLTFPIHGDSLILSVLGILPPVLGGVALIGMGRSMVANHQAAPSEQLRDVIVGR
jgi:hypothetical protein